MLASLTFVTPAGGLLALFVILPLIAFSVAAVRSARGRALLRLAPPASDRSVTLAALLAVPLLIGLAAMGPAWHTHSGRRVRTDTQAIFIFDTSRSMAAAPHFGAPTRFAQARAAAIKLRDTVIPEVPSGVASLTTQVLPHLFATSDVGVFNATVETAIGVERPPPPALQLGLTGTSFRPLVGLRDTGFFAPGIPRRLAILITDGESAQFDPAVLGQALIGQTGASSQFAAQGGQAPGGGFAREGEAPVHLFILRLGEPSDRIYNPNGSIEAQYRPDPRAGQIVDTLAADAHGYSSSSVTAIAAALRKTAGSGHASLQGATPKTIPLAPYVVLVALAPLGLLVRRRNLTKV